MKTFIILVIVIFLALVYLILHKRRDRLVSHVKPNELPYRLLAEGDRTLEEIMFSKPSNEVLAELNSKNLEDLTGNEVLVLSFLTKWYDENPSYKGS